MKEADLPFFVGLMEHLPRRGVICPQPVRARDGEALGRLAGRAAAIVTFLDGLWIRRPQRRSLRPGRRSAGAHARGRRRLRADAAPTRCRSTAGRRCSRPPKRAPTRSRPASQAETAAELAALAGDRGRAGLPSGVIHADLFPDNVFFLGDKLSGLIDFYFACNDAFAYDLGVCLNAWCFEPDGAFNVSKGMAMIRGYEKRRPLEPAEVEALPILARGSALRFMLTRLVDWLNVPPGAKVTPKNPLEYRDARCASTSASSAPATTAACA